MTFRREGGACLSIPVRKKSQNWFAFQQMKTMKHWKLQQ